MTDPGGTEIVRLSIEGATVAVQPPDDGPPDGGIGPGPYEADGPPELPKEPERAALGELPLDISVVPLGVSGELYFYIDGMSQLRALKARDHSKAILYGLFGTEAIKVYQWWPRLNKDFKVTGWHADHAAEALMMACAARGVWDVWGRVRGPGTWRDDDGRLVMHCGDVVVTAGKAQGPDNPAMIVQPPARYGRYVYPAHPATPRPAETSARGGDGSPGAELLKLFSTWAWRRDIDAHLLLGWVCAAMLGGALKWRPLVWITGDKATGKSTLHEVIHGVFGADGVLSVSDTSAAGIWQTLGHSTLPVAIDELEADEDNRRAQNIIKLARQAASGGVVLRGGSDHSANRFTARSCFMFSSILIPPLQGQDRSRMALLDLAPLGERRAPRIDSTELGEMGQALRRRLLDGWPRFGETLEAYHELLTAVGHGGRGADQFGALLACADIALHDHPPDAGTLGDWGDKLKAESMSENADDQADHERCLAHLLTSPLDIFRGGARVQIAEKIEEAKDDRDGVAARVELAHVGLTVKTFEGERWLAIANSHQGLAKVYEGTHWAGRSGAAGVWVQALRRVPGAVKSGPVRFGGVTARCTLVPIAEVLKRGDDG